MAEGVGQLGLHLGHLGLRRLHCHEAGFELRTPLREIAIEVGDLAIQRRVRLGVGLELGVELSRRAIGADVGIELGHKGRSQARRARGGIVEKLGDIRGMIRQRRIEFGGIRDGEARVTAREIEPQSREIRDRPEGRRTERRSAKLPEPGLDFAIISQEAGRGLARRRRVRGRAFNEIRHGIKRGDKGVDLAPHTRGIGGDGQDFRTRHHRTGLEREASDAMIVGVQGVVGAREPEAVDRKGRVRGVRRWRGRQAQGAQQRPARGIGDDDVVADAGDLIGEHNLRTGFVAGGVDPRFGVIDRGHDCGDIHVGRDGDGRHGTGRRPPDIEGARDAGGGACQDTPREPALRIPRGLRRWRGRQAQGAPQRTTRLIGDDDVVTCTRDLVSEYDLRTGFVADGRDSRFGVIDLRNDCGDVHVGRDGDGRHGTVRRPPDIKGTRDAGGGACQETPGEPARRGQMRHLHLIGTHRRRRGYCGLHHRTGVLVHDLAACAQRGRSQSSHGRLQGGQLGPERAQLGFLIVVLGLLGLVPPGRGTLHLHHRIGEGFPVEA